MKDDMTILEKRESSLQRLDVCLEKGFKCMLCNSTDFSTNAAEYYVCMKCGNIYHGKTIYENLKNK